MFCHICNTSFICKNPKFYKLNIKEGNAFEKVCFCHWQMLSSATCKMQGTKWNCSCKSKVLWHTCSYWQTTSSHFVPRSVSPSKFKILFEEMSKQWQSPKVWTPASVQLKHEASLLMNPWTLQSYLSVCKQIWTTNNVPILIKPTLHPIDVSFTLANILFFEAIVVPNSGGSTKSQLWFL